MSRVLEKTGCRVTSSDLYDRGFGEIGTDFLTTERQADNIVTNPPYNSAEGFVSAPGSKAPAGNSRCCFGLRFWRAPTAQTRFSFATRQAAYGSLVNALPFIRQVPFKKEPGQRPMHGSSGKRALARRNSNGSNPAIRRAIFHLDVLGASAW